MIPQKDLEQTSTTYLVQLLTEHDQWFAQGQHWATSAKAQAEAEQIRVELAKRAEHPRPELSYWVLDELVHEVASNMASNAINSGDQVEFLLGAGWTQDEITDAMDKAQR